MLSSGFCKSSKEWYPMKSTFLRTLTSWLPRRRPNPPTGPIPGGGSTVTEMPFYARDTSELWIMFGVGLVSLIVYILTFSSGVVPGLSAATTAQTLGLLPNGPATHPLWLLASKAVAAVPVFDTIWRLNLFSAVCGSLAVAWLFRITKRVLFEFIRDAPSIRLEPVEDEEPSTRAARGLPSGAEAFTEGNPDVMEHVYASLGGVIAALCCAFCAPFWIASNSLHVEPFNILFLLVTVDLLLGYLFTGKINVCVAAAFLVGLGLVESVVFVALAPLALILVLLASIRNNQTSESFILLIFAAGLSGLAANLFLFTLLSTWGQAFNTDLLFRLLSNLGHAHVNALTLGLPKTGWLLVLVQTTLPILLALVSLKRISPLQDESARWKWGVTNVFNTAFTVACLLDFPKTAWGLAREGVYLPVVSCLSIAVAAGALFVYWSLMAFENVYNECNDRESRSIGLRMLGCGMCALLAICTLRAIEANFNDADSRKASFADHIADDMLAQAGLAKCLVTDGTLDLNLLIRNHLTGGEIILLPYSTGASRVKPVSNENGSAFRLSLPRTETSEKTSPVMFVERWLRANPSEINQVAVIGNPQLWQCAGVKPVPHGFIYRGIDGTRTLDGKALLADNLEFWQKVAPALVADETLRPELRRVHDRVRACASRMANDLGVLLEEMGDCQGAESAYSEALKLDGDNLCSTLNRDGLGLRGKVPGASQSFISHAQELTAKPVFFDTFKVMTLRYGTLAPQEADMLLPAVLSNYRLGSKLPENIVRLAEKWLNASHTITQSQSPAITRAPRLADMAPDPILSQALSLWLDGQSEKAEKRLRMLVGLRPNNLSAWALLAEVLMTRGQLKEVSETVIPAMRAICKNPENTDRTLVEMVQGCLLMRAVPANPEGARACFERALAINPALTDACDQLLHADRVLGDAACLEADAGKIIAENPDHSEANAILGSLRLSQKRYAEAESFLRRSINSQPMAGTLNDLAELLRQRNQLTDAEREVRLAIRLAPCFYQAWDTLGNILTEQGRFEEAHGATHCALALSSNDPHLYLTLTRLHIKEGLFREAGLVLDQTQRLFAQTSPSVRDEYAKLRQQVRVQAELH